MGLPESCKRDLSVPRNWLGLSGDEATLLSVWLGRRETEPDELWTSVPVGPLPELPEAMKGTAVEKVHQNSSRWRIDAVVRWADNYFLVELKPDAGHSVIGQVAFYLHWWRREAGYPAVRGAVVVTDEADADIVEVLRDQGVDVVQLGQVLEFNRRNRRRERGW